MTREEKKSMEELDALLSDLACAKYNLEVLASGLEDLGGGKARYAVEAVTTMIRATHEKMQEIVTDIIDANEG